MFPDLYEFIVGTYHAFLRTSLADIQLYHPPVFGVSVIFPTRGYIWCVLDESKNILQSIHLLTKIWSHRLVTKILSHISDQWSAVVAYNCHLYLPLTIAYKSLFRLKMFPFASYQRKYFTGFFDSLWLGKCAKRCLLTISIHISSLLHRRIPVYLSRSAYDNLTLTSYSKYF